MSAKGYCLQGKKRQGIITIFTDDNGLKTVDYRGTDVVEEIGYNRVRLNTNGWKTVTSKVVMNRYFSQKNLDVRVFQKDFTWYVIQGNNTFEYVDGKVIEL